MRLFIFILLVCFTASSQGKTTYKHRFNKVTSFGGFEHQNIDFTANVKKTHYLSDYSVYAWKGQYQDSYADVQQKVAVLHHDEVIWLGAGLFPNVEFSANGKTIFIRSVSEHGEDYIVLTDGKETKSHLKYPKKRKLFFNFGGSGLYEISNDGSHFLRFFFIEDCCLRNPAIFNMKSDQGFQEVEFDGATGFSDIALLDDQIIATTQAVSIKDSYEQTDQYLVNVTLSLHAQGNLLWEKEFIENDDFGVHVQGFYKNLVFVSYKRGKQLAIFDVQSGEELWTTSGLDESVRLERFSKAFINKNRLIVHYADRTKYIAKHLGNFIN